MKKPLQWREGLFQETLNIDSNFEGALDALKLAKDKL